MSRTESKIQLLKVLLKEYETIKQEGVSRLGFYFQVFQVYFLLIGTIYSLIIVYKQYDILLFFPWLSFGLFMRLYWDQTIGIQLSKYMNHDLSRRINGIINELDPSGTEDTENLHWGVFFEKTYRKIPQYNKHSMFIIFGIISFLPSIVFCSYSLLAIGEGWTIIFTKLPVRAGIWIMPADLILFISILWWMARAIYHKHLS